MFVLGNKTIEGNIMTLEKETKKEAKELPKWLSVRYNMLWKEFKDETFGFDDATSVLEKKTDDRDDSVLVILSELRKAGWLFTKPHPQNGRRKIYNLKSRTEMIQETLSVEGKALSRSEIDSILKKAADLIRTRVDYKFILILLFFKRISDKWELEYDKVYEESIRDGLSKDQAKSEAANAAYHDFDMPQEYLWENLRKDVSNLPAKFSRALKEIADRNPELKDVMDSVDFVQFISSRENSEILRQLFELFSEKKLHRVAPDILGDAYEWILGYFAPTKAKEGEIYTPREVIKLLVEILDPTPKESVYDPACGSAGMLISSYEHVRKNVGNEGASKLFLFGQEANQKTVALAKMNMYIHGISNSHLEYGDTLLYPKFKEEKGVKKFDVVIANPPWNQDGYDETIVKKGEFWRQRFSYGFSPKNTADWTWIQHMIASSNDENGRIGIVIDNGCLFRTGREKAIRSSILEADLIECVILLPEKLFYNTGAPGAIMILNKNKSIERKSMILFINASEEFQQHPDVRKLKMLNNDHIGKIVAAYMNFIEEAGFSRIVSISDIERNDYNLNVTFYVFPEDDIEEIDLEKEWKELQVIEEELVEIEQKLHSFLKEIGALQ